MAHSHYSDMGLDDPLSVGVLSISVRSSLCSSVRWQEDGQADGNHSACCTVVRSVATPHAPQFMGACTCALTCLLLRSSTGRVAPTVDLSLLRMSGSLRIGTDTTPRTLAPGKCALTHRCRQRTQCSPCSRPIPVMHMRARFVLGCPAQPTHSCCNAEAVPVAHSYSMQAFEALPLSPRANYSAAPRGYKQTYASGTSNVVRVQAMPLQQVRGGQHGVLFVVRALFLTSLSAQVVPMARGYSFGYDDPLPQQQIVHARAVSAEYMPSRSNFKDLMTVEAVPYPQYDNAWYQQDRAYTPSLSTNSPPASPQITRNQSKMQRSAPPPRPLSSEEEEEEEELPVFAQSKKRAQRSAQRAPMPLPDVPPEVIIVDHEEPKFRVVQVENEVLVPRREKILAETITVNERLIDVEKIKLTEELVDVEKIVVREVQVPFDVYVGT